MPFDRAAPMEAVSSAPPKGRKVIVTNGKATRGAKTNEDKIYNLGFKANLTTR